MVLNSNRSPSPVGSEADPQTLVKTEEIDQILAFNCGVCRTAHTTVLSSSEDGTK